MLRSHEPHLGRKVSAWKRINTEVTDGSKEVLLRKFQGRTPRRAERRSAAQHICTSQRGSAGRGRLQGRGRREEAPRDERRAQPRPVLCEDQAPQAGRGNGSWKPRGQFISQAQCEFGVFLLKNGRGRKNISPCEENW